MRAWLELGALVAVALLVGGKLVSLGRPAPGYVVIVAALVAFAVIVRRSSDEP